ncbi:hypothetical protein NBRC116584_25100 [Hydrogenophaga sp. 5NK40-0174]
MLPPKGVPLRAPKHPGKLLAQLCLKPLSLNQSEAARQLGLSRRRLHELVHGQRAMSPDTAIRCARQFGIDAGFLLRQQAAWDSFQAWKRLEAAEQAAANDSTEASASDNTTVVRSALVAPSLNA